MKKPSKVAEAIAKRAFTMPQLQQAWQVHMQAFGPILAPAYPDCFTAKVHITNIFNKLSRQDAVGAKDTMAALVKSCGEGGDAEQALLGFMEGLCGEITGDLQAMVSGYIKAGQFKHSFYLPYLKVAKAAHQDAELDIAYSEYAKALDCIRSMQNSNARDQLLASTLTSIASLLTSMHWYIDAMDALTEAKSTQHIPGMESIEAILLTILDRHDEASACLQTLAETGHPALDRTRATVEAIINETEPHFCILPADEDAIADFWHWFGENEADLLERCESDAPGLCALICSRLAPCFPFMHRALQMSLEPGTDMHELRFFDYYNRSLCKGYNTLVSACPPALAERWNFSIEH